MKLKIGNFLNIYNIKKRVSWKRRKEATKAIGNLSERKMSVMLASLRRNKIIKNFRKALASEDENDKFDFEITCLDDTKIVFDAKTRPLRRRKYHNILVPKIPLAPEDTLRERLISLIRNSQKS